MAAFCACAHCVPPGHGPDRSGPCAGLARGGSFGRCRFARDGSAALLTAVNCAGDGHLLRWEQVCRPCRDHVFAGRRSQSRRPFCCKQTRWACCWAQLASMSDAPKAIHVRGQKTSALVKGVGKAHLAEKLLEVAGRRARQASWRWCGGPKRTTHPSRPSISAPRGPSWAQGPPRVRR